jgi:hypothetical protein
MKLILSALGMVVLGSSVTIGLLEIEAPFWMIGVVAVLFSIGIGYWGRKFNDWLQEKIEYWTQ